MKIEPVDDDQRRDALLLRLLITPPSPRPKREHGDGKAISESALRASEEKPAPAA